MTGQIYITLGNHTDMGITDDNHLVLTHHENGKVLNRIDLGLATAKRINDLQEFLDRLKIHAVEEGVL